MKINSIKFLRFLLTITLSFVCVSQSLAVGMKGTLTGDEIDYIDNAFYPILIKAHICKEAHKDCSGKYIFCSDSDEALACNVYGITDDKVVRELFMSMLNSGLKVS